jgi:hypothetical protein
VAPLERHPRLRRSAFVALAVVFAGVALADVDIIEPRIHVRWSAEVSETRRLDLERRYNLSAGERLQGTTWRYELHDRSADNVRAIVEDAAVVDTAYIDRPTLTVPSREVDVSFHRLRALAGPHPMQLLRVQSVAAFAAGALLLWAAGRGDARRRRTIALGALAFIGVAAYALPLGRDVRMGDADTYTATRESFENYSGVREVRFEAHLSHAILGRLYAGLGTGADVPQRAFGLLTGASTAFFLLTALAVGIVESWSPTAIRYLALALIAPSSLMYFGYRELGHLSLNVATFPLLMRGMASGTTHLEASGVLAGFGSALHGFGLLSVAGAVLATTASRLRPLARMHALLRFVPWAVAAYLGWIAIYLIVLKLPVVGGHAESIPLRPWFMDVVTDRINAAIFSGRGARDVIVTALVVGMPLLPVAVSLRHRFPVETRMALLYALPSTVFAILFWPIQGLAVEMDLVFAAFPALYALAWVCAHDERRTVIAAGLLAFAHLVFWRIVLDSAFVNARV